jgi:hypothetical protein
MAKAHIPYIEIKGNKDSIRLRKSLFWDVPENNLDLDKNKRLILERVFTRGNIEEFRLVNMHYSKEVIRETVKKIGSLDNKTLRFLSRVYQIKPDEFKCYKEKL